MSGLIFEQVFMQKYKFHKPFIIDERLTFYRVSPTNVSYKFKHLSSFYGGNEDWIIIIMKSYIVKNINTIIL